MSTPGRGVPRPPPEGASNCLRSGRATVALPQAASSRQTHVNARLTIRRTAAGARSRPRRRARHQPAQTLAVAPAAVAGAVAVDSARAGVAGTALADSAAHRRMACPDRAARQRGARRAGTNRSDHGALARLGAGAGTARRQAARRATAHRAAPAARGGGDFAAVAARPEGELRPVADRRRRARRAPQRRRPDLRRRHRPERRHDRRREHGRRLVLVATRIRDPRRHIALDRRAARRADGRADRRAARHAQRPAHARPAPGRDTATRLGRPLPAHRALHPAADGAGEPLATLERARVRGTAACRPEPVAPPRRPAVRAERGPGRVARLVRAARRFAAGSHHRPEPEPGGAAIGSESR